MPNDLTIDPMTLAEAREMNEIAKGYAENRAKADVSLMIAQYLIHVRDGWKKLNHPTFEDYCETVLHTPRSTVYDRLKQVQTTLDAKGISVKDLSTMWTNEIERERISLFPTTISRELSKLKTAELRAKAWEEFEHLNAANDTDPHALHMKSIALQRIVKRLLGEAETPPAPAETDRELTARKAAELESKEAERQAEQEDASDEADFFETEEEAREAAGAAPVESDFVEPKRLIVDAERVIYAPNDPTVALVRATLPNGCPITVVTPKYML